MGILNVTPDSFSDGGFFADRDSAVAHGLRMLNEGADIIDVGGESTRPGAVEVAVEEEMDRVVPVVEKLFQETGAVISVDTRKAGVAVSALEAGACIVNDVSALTYDPAMAAAVRKYRAGAVLMHMIRTPATMQADPRYDDVVREVGDYLEKRVNDLAGAGLDRESLAIDPGIGFGKTVEHNLSLIASVDMLTDRGQPVAVGVSRKSFIGRISGCLVDQRLPGSLAALAVCVMKGAGILRVHDVKESKQAAMIAAALARRGN